MKTAPEAEGHDPEILYGLAREFWGQGLASEAAEAAITWLFGHTQAPGLSALIFGRLSARNGRRAGLPIARSAP